MEIINKKLTELIPYKNNPRKNDEAVKYVANSIRDFGFKVPIVIDKNNVIVAGHTRYKASQQLGLKEVPCIVADDLTEEQIKAFRLADNKVSEKADWDYNLLDLELEDFDIDMSEFGFEELEINPEKFGTDFTLDSGEKLSLVNMVVSLTQEQFDYIVEQINNMKGTKEYKEFKYEENKNSNGNSLFLICKQWEEQNK
jgi:hypothetical protein